MSFFSGFINSTQDSKLRYIPPGLSEAFGTTINIITSILTLFSLAREYDKLHVNYPNYNIDKILISFIILAILLITLYYIIREPIIDKNKQDSDININIVYFSLSIILLLVYLVYVYKIKKPI
jgi:hypothetical protein